MYHKFKVGEQVKFFPGILGQADRGNAYKIERLLPEEGGTRQYRIKCVSDGHERVVKEGELG
jgi:hypothetical protein